MALTPSRPAESAVAAPDGAFGEIRQAYVTPFLMSGTAL